MTPRRKRLFVVLAILGGVAASVVARRHGLAREHHVLLRPEPGRAGQAPLSKRFRVGGMVVKGSVSRKPGDLRGALRADRLRAPGPGRIHRRAA